MTEYEVLSLIALGGFLILALSGLRGRRINMKQAVLLAGTWVLIFAVIAFAATMLLEN